MKNEKGLKMNRFTAPSIGFLASILFLLLNLSGCEEKENSVGSSCPSGSHRTWGDCSEKRPPTSFDDYTALNTEASFCQGRYAVPYPFHPRPEGLHETLRTHDIFHISYYTVPLGDGRGYPITRSDGNRRGQPFHVISTTTFKREGTPVNVLYYMNPETAEIHFVVGENREDWGLFNFNRDSNAMDVVRDEDGGFYSRRFRPYAACKVTIEDDEESSDWIFIYLRKGEMLGLHKDNAYTPLFYNAVPQRSGE